MSSRALELDGHLPRLIAWEVTRTCILSCKHCRAAAEAKPYDDELSTRECFALLRNIASFARPIVILTGGEPMLRGDIYDIAAHAHALGLPVVMASCGMLIDEEAAERIKRSGVRRISISLDGATAASHDGFRGARGAFEGALGGIEAAKRAGLDFQINTTVTTHNRDELGEILRLAVKLKASVFNPFMLVATGRGKQLAEAELSGEQYEQTLRWLARRQAGGEIPIRVTCAPQYQRILRQLHVAPSGRPAAGCMGGQSFAFISHRGKVQICGFLDLECGDLRAENLDFRRIWETSEVFLKLRDTAAYHGRCGRCEFAEVCGGCRARAWAATGDYLDEEPLCTYQPKRPAPGDLDNRILSVVQTDFPAVEAPYDLLAERLNAPAGRIMARIEHLRASGLIRRLGAVFDSRKLGYASTLVAARVPPARLAEVVPLINALAGVTHNYRREHVYNLWFTLIAESAERIDETLSDLRRRTGLTSFHSLPALAVYKLHVDFSDSPGPSRTRQGAKGRKGGNGPGTFPPLDERGKQLVRLLQGDLPAGARPLEQLLAGAAWSPKQAVRQIDEWLASGVIRRFGAVVNHRHLGYLANGMAVFAAPAERIDEIGGRLAACHTVSHCYRRPPLPDLPYNLYAMFHGRSRHEVHSEVARLAGELNLNDYVVLFSAAEYKKTSMAYFTCGDA